MDYKDYSKQKLQFDKMVMQYICKRLLEPIEDTDAYKAELIDSAGQMIAEINNTNQWAMTPLDMLVFNLRSTIGNKNLQAMLGNYSSTSYADPLSLINKPNLDYDNFKTCADSLITKVESKEYLPDYLYHDSDQTWSEPDEEGSFNERLSKALTILTYLLYCLRNDKLCSSIDFKCNISPSVECTFNVKPYDDYEWIADHCLKCGLTADGKISDEGMRLLHHASKDIVKAGLINDKRTRVEDQSYNWKQLSGI